MANATRSYKDSRSLLYPQSEAKGLPYSSKCYTVLGAVRQPTNAQAYVDQKSFVVVCFIEPHRFTDARNVKGIW